MAAKLNIVFGIFRITAKYSGGVVINSAKIWLGSKIRLIGSLMVSSIFRANVQQWFKGDWGLSPMLWFSPLVMSPTCSSTGQHCTAAAANIYHFNL